MADALAQIFSLRREFMKLISSKIPDAYPDWPIDLREKKNQQAIRELAFRGMEELFEALLHLKNWKDHRDGVTEFNREEFLEEMIDSFNYFLAIMILVDVDEEEFITAFRNKHKIICNRLK